MGTRNDDLERYAVRCNRLQVVKIQITGQKSKIQNPNECIKKYQNSVDLSKRCAYALGLAKLSITGGNIAMGLHRTCVDTQSFALEGATFMRRILPTVLVWLLACAPSFAQTLGTITGDVKDSSGAVIPGATVSATNTGTNAVRESQSNEAGVYSFAALPPGPYVVKAELQGFRTVTQAVELHVEQTVRVNFTMEIGTLSETTEVTGVAPLITTENATVGTIIENRRIVELPLNGRNFLSLVALSPNVSAEFAGAGQAGDRQGGSRSRQQLSISGQRREFNYFTLDGVDNTDVNFNTYILLPSVDALEEFKVQTGIYSAEFGRGASQVNVVTKSGTNQFHGAIFEFVRNDKFDSKPYQFTSIAPPKPPFKWNQYGYTAGGPVAIPGVFDFRNRLFFMSNFEGYKDRK